MPKSGKGRSASNKTRWREQAHAQADVTLDDFANSKASGGRLKKAASNSLVREAKHLQGSATDDLEWFEKDLDDFDIDFASRNQIPWDQEDEEDEEANEQKSSGDKSRRCNTRNKGKTKQENFDGGTSYPLDLWYILSDYIQPEDVKIFACICKNALAVVNSFRFWLRLYQRYYKNGIILPERLQPECIIRPRGLRARVIRSLYYTYPSFANRLRATQPFDDKSHTLVRSQCILTWHEKVKNNWNFYFKFLRILSDRHEFGVKKKGRGISDLLQILDDINNNSEDGYQVLQVTCQTFIPTPVVIGLKLAQVTFNMNLCQPCHYRLRLIFDTTMYGSTFREHSASGTVVTLEPVASIRVLDWWHPQYPHTTD